MTERYFVERPIAADSAVLSGPEAHHLLHVMRAQVGAEVVLFDGSGCEFAARVERVSRSEASLAVLARREVDRELPFRLTLGVALPKGDRQRWLVEKAVELGATRLVPLGTERAVATAAADPPARLRRSVIEAAKQCGRNRLLEIAPGVPLKKYLASGAGPTDGGPSEAGIPDGCVARLLAHPGGTRLRAALDALPSLVSGGQVLLAVGPEGGFAPAEVAAAQSAGWQIVDLGPRILRIETAACYLIAAVAGHGS